MPIEIAEVVIRARVSDQSHAQGEGVPEESAQTTSRFAEPTESEKAVKEILDILKRKNER